MFEEAMARLEDAGLLQYELSNFAIAGRESKHNLKYWTRKPYLGIGVDAHSMLRLRASEAGGDDFLGSLRFGYGDDLEEFLGGPAAWDPEMLTRRAELEEAWFLGLRLSSGVRLQELRGCFGAEAVDCFLPVLGRMAEDRLVQMDEQRVWLTARGKLLSNEVFSSILEVGDEEVCLTK
jgi:oxygen-independent coproporphyrinogen III oxidase